jgi:hypothetical protein
MKVLFWSGGENSTKVLESLLGTEFDIVQIRNGWTKEEKKEADELIKKFNLKVFSYPPIDYVDGQGVFVAGKELVSIPLREDPEMRMNFSPMDWDEILVGK